MTQNTEYDYLCRVLLIGDSGVGKSCLSLRFAEDSYVESYITTIGVDFKFKNIEVDGKTIKMQIWDTEGQERLKAITNSYYRDAHGMMIVYDISDRVSFQHVETWIQEINTYANDKVIKMLVGNKSDLEAKRKVSTYEGQALAESHGMQFMETSARSSTNVHESFKTIAKKIKQEIMEKPSTTLTSGVTVTTFPDYVEGTITVEATTVEATTVEGTTTIRSIARTLLIFFIIIVFCYFGFKFVVALI
jgi:Ras-related protein Rab-1A